MRRSHRQCLANIGRLERDLFPDLPEGLRWAPWPPRSYEPGAIFEVWPGGLPLLHFHDAQQPGVKNCWFTYEQAP